MSGWKGYRVTERGWFVLGLLLAPVIWYGPTALQFIIGTMCRGAIALFT